MSSDAGAPSVNGASGNGAGIPSASDGVDVAALVNEAVNKALGARLKRIDLEGQITKAVEAALAKATPASADKPQEHPTQPASDGAEPGKLSMKALQDQVSNLTKQLAAQQKAREEADARAKDTRARAVFREKLSAKLGADSPLLDPIMDSLYDVKKRVVENEGRLLVKFQDQWGGEELKPIDEGITALFDTELKPLVQQSKANALPPTGIRGATGSPFGAQRPAPPKGISPLDMDLIEAVAKDRPELAQALAEQAAAASAAKK